MNFQTWKFKGQQYVAVDNGDGWHVIRGDGENYGAWQTIETFRKLQRDNDPNGVSGLPGSKGKLQIRIAQYMNQNNQTLGSHEDGRVENEKYIFIEGYELTNDHLTTGERWFRLIEKASGERHSGPKDFLLSVFHGKLTLDQFYDMLA